MLLVKNSSIIFHAYIYRGNGVPSDSKWCGKSVPKTLKAVSIAVLRLNPFSFSIKRNHKPSPKYIRTLRPRVKDKHAVTLACQSRAVNYVSNYINELSERSTREHGTFLSAFDIHRHTTGASKELQGRWYRAGEHSLATAQRAGKKKRAKAIHAKIRNSRKDSIDVRTIDERYPFLANGELGNDMDDANYRRWWK
jgi:hypothetical protein